MLRPQLTRLFLPLVAFGLLGCASKGDTTNDTDKEQTFFNQSLSEEIKSFSSLEGAIDKCAYEADKRESAFFRPYCRFSSAKTVSDVVTGRVCVVGPGKGVMVRRGPTYGPFSSGAIMIVFGYRPDRSNPLISGKEVPSYFAALFDGKGKYIGVRCPEDDEFQN